MYGLRFRPSLITALAEALGSTLYSPPSRCIYSANEKVITFVHTAELRDIVHCMGARSIFIVSL